jgi:hypothetical protein
MREKKQLICEDSGDKIIFFPRLFKNVVFWFLGMISSLFDQFSCSHTVLDSEEGGARGKHKPALGAMHQRVHRMSCRRKKRQGEQKQQQTCLNIANFLK